MKKALVFGATGMVGSLVLKECLNSDEISKVVIFSRREGDVKNEKLEEVIIPDLLEIEKHDKHFQNVDLVFFCVGVYTGAVGKEEFLKITVDAPRAVGKVLQQESPDASFCLLSGQGADRSEKSRVLFAKAKGQIENQLSEMGFGKFYSFRPGYIYPVTKRKEPSLMYRLSRSLYPLIRLFGSGTSIKSTELAQAIFQIGLNSEIEHEVFENKDMMKFLSKGNIT